MRPHWVRFIVASCWLLRCDTLCRAAATPTAAPSDPCNLDSTRPRVSCPTSVTLLGRTALLTDLASVAVANDKCGVASVTQHPPSGTVLAINTTTLVNITATDLKGNSKTCTVVVTVPPISLLYQVSFPISGRKSENQRTSFIVPTRGDGLIHSITGTLSKNLYYYSEVVRAMLFTSSSASVPSVAVSPRILIQWRRRVASHAYDPSTSLVAFTNGTNFTLAMWSNYIQSPYSVTYRF